MTEEHASDGQTGGPDPTSLAFTEDMKGFVATGETDPATGERTGEARGERLWAHLTITIDGVRRFVAEPEHPGSVVGFVEGEALGGRWQVDAGTFHLFVDRGDPRVKYMRYRLFARRDGDERTVSGYKLVRDDGIADIWRDTSTLFTRVFAGHVEPGDEATAGVLAAGVIHVHLLDFLHQLTTFRVRATSPVDGAAVLGEFGAFFMGSLWAVYGPRVLDHAQT